MLWEITQLGFGAAEISHGTSVSLLPGILHWIENRGMRITSVHNFCPAPVEANFDNPDVYEFTSRRSIERQRALDLTMRSLETAARCGAEVLVVHLGSTSLRGASGRLEEMARRGELFSRRYCAEKLRLVERRERLGEGCYGPVRDLVGMIAERGAELGVRIGVESRSHYEQVPDEREMVRLMEEFRDNPWVGYWHDFGHVQRKANLGLLDHAEWVARMAPFWLGSHVHDVDWPAHDHRIPFSSGRHGIDFGGLLPLVPRDKPLVWELSPRHTKRERIREALEVWRERFPQTAGPEPGAARAPAVTKA